MFTLFSHRSSLLTDVRDTRFVLRQVENYLYAQHTVPLSCPRQYSNLVLFIAILMKRSAAGPLLTLIHNLLFERLFLILVFPFFVSLLPSLLLSFKLNRLVLLHFIAPSRFISTNSHTQKKQTKDIQTLLDDRQNTNRRRAGFH